jgi:ribosomal protein S18 acetylase RimI-like enzyme
MAHGIRDAQLSDVEAIEELLSELGYPRPEDTRSRIAAWLEDPANRLLVAEVDGEVAAVLALHTWPHLARSGSRARITALAVAPGRRRQGLARRLVAAAEKAAIELGCTEIEVTSRRSRTEAHPFYIALGYEDVNAASARYMRPLRRDD